MCLRLYVGRCAPQWEHDGCKRCGRNDRPRWGLQLGRRPPAQQERVSPLLGVKWLVYAAMVMPHSWLRLIHGYASFIGMRHFMGMPHACLIRGYASCMGMPQSWYQLEAHPFSA